MIPFAVNKILINDKLVTASGGTLYVDNIPLLTGFRFSGYTGDSFIQVENNNYVLSFSRYQTGIVQNNIAHTSLDSSIGTVLDDGYNGSLAYYFFDKNVSTARSMYDQIPFNGQPSTPAWVQYYFKTGTYVDKYGINSVVGTNGRPPKTWDLSGSFDGNTWYLLDTHTNTFGFSDNVENQFDITSPDYYKYYRLLVKAHDSNTFYNATELREINFYCKQDRLPFWNEIRFINSGDGFSIYGGKNETEVILKTLSGVSGIGIVSQNGSLVIGYTGITGSSAVPFNPFLNGTNLSGDWNLSGIGSIQITASGNNLLFYSVGGGGGSSVSVNSGLAISGVANFIPSGDIQLTQNGNDVIIGYSNNQQSIRYSLSGYYIRQTKAIYSNSYLSTGTTANYIKFPLSGTFDLPVLSNSIVNIAIEGGVGGSAGSDIGVTIFRDNAILFTGASSGFARTNIQDAGYGLYPFHIESMDTGVTGTNPVYGLGFRVFFGNGTVSKRYGDTIYDGQQSVLYLREYAYGPQFSAIIPSGTYTKPAAFFVGNSAVNSVGSTKVAIPFNQTGTSISGYLNNASVSGNGIVIRESGYYNIDLQFTVGWNATCTVHGALYNNGNLIVANDFYYQSLPGGYGGQFGLAHFGYFNSGDFISVSGWSDNSVNFASGGYIRGVKQGNTTNISNIITPGSGSLQNPYDIVRITEETASGVAGGASTSLTIHTRKLNSIYPSGSFVSVNGGYQFIISGSGLYEINASAPAVGAYNHQIRLYDNITNSPISYGTSEWNVNTAQAQTRSILNCPLTITGLSGVYTLQHWIYNGRSTDGLGIPTFFGKETYAEVIVKRINPIAQGIYVQINNTAGGGGGTSNFSVNGLSGTSIFTGVSGVAVTTSGNTLWISPTGLLYNNQTGQFYPSIGNPSGYLSTGDGDARYINISGDTLSGYLATTVMSVNNVTTDKIIDWRSGNMFEVVINGTTNLIFTGDRNGQTITLVTSQTGISQGIITFPSSVKWVSGIVPSGIMNTGTFDIYTFIRLNSSATFGTVVQGFR